MRHLLSGLLLLFVFSGSLHAQPLDQAVYIRALYRQHLGREPAIAEIRTWLDNMRNGLTPVQVNLAILGSEESWLRCGSNPIQWVQAIYLGVLNRQPSVEDVRNCVETLRNLNGDRAQFVADFYVGAQRELANLPNPIVPINPVGVPTRLVTSSTLLAQAIQAEIPGPRGFLVQTQANHLLSIVRNSQAILANPALDPRQADGVVREMETAINTAREGLAQFPYANASRAHADQTLNLIGLLRAGIPVIVLPPPPPPPPPPVFNGLDEITVQRYSRQLGEVSRETRQTLTALRYSGGPNFTTTRIIRDVEIFESSVADLQARLRVGMPIPVWRTSVETLKTQVNGITARVSVTTVSTRVQQSWFETVNHVNRLATLCGLPGVNRFDPNHVPVVSPAFDGINFPTGGLGGSIISPQAIAATDAAISRCDILAAEFGSVGFNSPAMVRLQAQVRVVRNELGELRQRSVVNPNVIRIRTELTEVNTRMGELQNQWRAMSSGGFLPANAPDLRELSLAINVVNSTYPVR